MNKAELIDYIAQEIDVTKKIATSALDKILEAITAQLAKGEKVILTGFGTFEARKRAARTGRNPQTGEAMQIKASVQPVFKAGKVLKDSVQDK
jgi:DNA-binding protein HU-beta